MTDVLEKQGRPLPANAHRPLRVGLGYEAGLLPAGGIGRYTRQLAAGLLSDTRIEDVRCFAQMRWLAPRDIRDSRPLATDEVHRHTFTRQLLNSGSRLVSRLPFGASAARDFLRQRIVRRAFAGERLDLYHEPGYIPPRVPVPVVLTLHDVSIFSHPQHHPVERVRYLARELPRAASEAAFLITISEFSRRELLKYCDPGHDRIAVIPIGVDPQFYPRNEPEVAEALHRHRLAWREYLLFVGTLEPRKNLQRTLEAHRLLPRALARRFPLVVVGGKGWNDAALLRSLDEACRDGVARHLGAVDDANLAALYSAARGVVFPSLYEGQGLPALEAAVSGIPVLTSENSAMIEMLEGLEVSVDPLDVSSIRDGLLRLIDDDTLAQRSLQAAEPVARRFSWARTLDETIAVYRRAVGTG